MSLNQLTESPLKYYPVFHPTSIWDDFRMPIGHATIEIAIAIENDQSLKLCQTGQVAFAFVNSYSINTECEAFWPLSDPHMGPRDWVRGRERRGKRNMER
jgi:hypothetical protein